MTVLVHCDWKKCHQTTDTEMLTWFTVTNGDRLRQFCTATHAAAWLLTEYMVSDEILGATLG